MVRALPNEATDVESAGDATKELGKKFNGLRDFIRECIEGKILLLRKLQPLHTCKPEKCSLRDTPLFFA